MGDALTSARARTLAHETDDDVLYAEIVTADRTRLLAEAIERGLQKNRVSWARLYRDIAQKIGRRFEVDAEVVHRLGVPLTEAQRAVQAVQRVELLDEDGMYRLALDRVQAYHRARGERVVVLRDAEAEEAE